MGNDRLRLRPHHILCTLFLPGDFISRGEVFNRSYDEIKTLISTGRARVEVAEGVDDLCPSCPDCDGEKCASVSGDEAAVRKWDAKIRAGLSIEIGDVKSTDELRGIIALKAPLPFCRERCPWATVCGVFADKENRPHR